MIETDFLPNFKIYHETFKMEINVTTSAKIEVNNDQMIKNFFLQNLFKYQLATSTEEKLKEL